MIILSKIKIKSAIDSSRESISSMGYGATSNLQFMPSSVFGVCAYFFSFPPIVFDCREVGRYNNKNKNTDIVFVTEEIKSMQYLVRVTVILMVIDATGVILKKLHRSLSILSRFSVPAHAEVSASGYLQNSKKSDRRRSTTEKIRHI